MTFAIFGTVCTTLVVVALWLAGKEKMLRLRAEDLLHSTRSDIGELQRWCSYDFPIIEIVTMHLLAASYSREGDRPGTPHFDGWLGKEDVAREYLRQRFRHELAMPIQHSMAVTLVLKNFSYEQWGNEFYVLFKHSAAPRQSTARIVFTALTKAECDAWVERNAEKYCKEPRGTFMDTKVPWKRA